MPEKGRSKEQGPGLPGKTEKEKPRSPWPPKFGRALEIPHGCGFPPKTYPFGPGPCLGPWPVEEKPFSKKKISAKTFPTRPRKKVFLETKIHFKRGWEEEELKGNANPPRIPSACWRAPAWVKKSPKGLESCGAFPGGSLRGGKGGGGKGNFALGGHGRFAKGPTRPGQSFWFPRIVAGGGGNADESRREFSRGGPSGGPTTY